MNRTPSEIAEDEYVQAVSRRIKFYRLERKLALERLARKADVSRETLRLVEDGLRMPTLKTLHRIAGALGITIDKLTTHRETSADVDGGFTEPNGYPGRLVGTG